MIRSPRFRLATLTVATALIAGACASGDIGEVFDIFDESDLSSSGDPAVRASGDTVVEVLSAREAEENLERGLSENDPDAIARAGAIRPDDPRYPLHEAALLESTDKKASQLLVGRATALVMIANPDYSACWSGVETDETLAACLRAQRDSKRVTTEMYLDATRSAYFAATDEAVRARLRDQYCNGIEKKYPLEYTDEFPSQVAFYLATDASFGICS